MNLSVSFAIIHSTDSMKPDRGRLHGQSTVENTIVPLVLVYVIHNSVKTVSPQNRK